MATTEKPSTTPLFIFNMTFPPMRGNLFSAQGGDMVTVEEHFILLRCQFAIRTLICIGGMLGNIINIVTFIKMGLEDSVTIAFFNLAISDFFFLASALAHTVGTLCQILQRDLKVYFYFEPYYFILVIVTFGRTFLFSNGLITTFLAIQRCLCVVRPLHFKGAFTRYRSNLVMIIVWTYCLACGVTFVAQYDIREEWTPETNSSKSILALRPTRRYVLAFIVIGNHLIVNISCVVFVFLCVFVMAHALRRSVQFRQKASTARKGHAQNEEDGGRDEDVGTSSKISVNSSKERQVIVQVSIVSAFFLISNTPAVIMSIVSSVFPEFEVYTSLHYTFWTCFELRLTIECINSAVNFLVYFKYNSKFKEICIDGYRPQTAK